MAGHACATRALTGLLGLSISPPPLAREPAGHAGWAFAPQLFDKFIRREGIRGRRAQEFFGAFAERGSCGLAGIWFVRCGVICAVSAGYW